MRARTGAELVAPGALGVNWANPITRGLVALFRCGQWPGGGVRDLVAGDAHAPFTNGGQVVTLPPYGPVLDCTAADRGARMTAPPRLRELQLPFSLMVRFVWTGVAPSANACLFGITYDDADSIPYLKADINFNGSQFVRGFWSTGTGSYLFSDAAQPTVGLNVSTLSLATGDTVFRHNQYTYPEASALVGGLDYNATSRLSFGFGNGAGRNARSYLIDCAIWARPLAALEHDALRAPDVFWDLYRRPGLPRWCDVPAAAAGVSFPRQPHTRPRLFAPGHAR